MLTQHLFFEHSTLLVATMTNMWKNVSLKSTAKKLKIAKLLRDAKSFGIRTSFCFRHAQHFTCRTDILAKGVTMRANLQSYNKQSHFNFRNKKQKHMVFACVASQLVHTAIASNNASTHWPGNPDVIRQVILQDRSGYKRHVL